MSKSPRLAITTWRSTLAAACLVTLGSACGSSSDNGATGSGGSSSTQASGGATQQQFNSGGSTQVFSSGGATGSGGATSSGQSGGSFVQSSGGSGSGGTTGSSSGGATSTAASGGTSGGSGGTTGAAGGTTGGGTGTAGQGGPSLCPVAGAVICDGFEGAAPGAATSDFTTDGTAPVVDTTKFYRGSKSIKFSGAAMSYITTTKAFTGMTKATNNNFWGRYFIFDNWTTADVPQAHAVYGTMSGTGTPGDGMFHFVGGSRGKLQAEIRNTGDSYTDNMKAPAATDPSFPVMTDGWQCWEFHVQPDDSFDFYINGAEVMEMKITAGKANMSGSSFSPLPIINKFQIGWQYFGSAMNSGWIDEVAIGPNRIPCGS